MEAGQRAWADLIADVEAAAERGIDPASPDALALAERWRELVRGFTRDDAEVTAGLNKLWSDGSHRPADFKRPWSDAANRLICAAMRGLS